MGSVYHRGLDAIGPGAGYRDAARVKEVPENLAKHEPAKHEPAKREATKHEAAKHEIAKREGAKHEAAKREATHGQRPAREKRKNA